MSNQTNERPYQMGYKDVLLLLPTLSREQLQQLAKFAEREQRKADAEQELGLGADWRKAWEPIRARGYDSPADAMRSFHSVMQKLDGISKEY